MKALRFLSLALVAALFACSSPIGQQTDQAAQRAVGNLPDLVVTNVRVTDFTSTSIYYSYTVTNLGTVAVNKAQVAVQGYISTDQTIGGGDVAAGGRIVDISGQIQPGESVDQSGSCGFYSATVHPELGTQYLILEVDAGNQIAESNETNNLGIVQILPKLPDLVISNVSVDDYTDTSISYSWDISNIGLLPANKADVAVQTYISSDQVINAGDVASGGRIIDTSGQIMPGETIHMNFSASVPVGTLHPQTSTQYLLVLADSGNLVAEQNESNNLANALIVPRLPDLVLTDVTVDDYTDTSISYSWTIKNIGNKPANKAQVAVQAYVSADQVVNSGDVAAGGRIVDTTGQLMPGDSVRVSFSASVPAGTLHPQTATQYLLLVADSGNQVTELNETNNVAAALIVPLLPDLIVTNLIAYPSETSISYSFTVKNIGNKTADTNQVVAQAYIVNQAPNGGLFTLKTRFLRKFPPILEPADPVLIAAGGFVLGPFGTSQLAPGASADFTFQASLPADWQNASVTQSLQIQIDASNALVESNEGNNATTVLIHNAGETTF